MFGFFHTQFLVNILQSIVLIKRAFISDLLSHLTNMRGGYGAEELLSLELQFPDSIRRTTGYNTAKHLLYFYLGFISNTLNSSVL